MTMSSAVSISPNRNISEMTALVRQLVARLGCVGFKIETESEGASPHEILLLQHVVEPFAPLAVKIGGCNARTDMTMARTFGLHHLIAPMIESAYAVENFREAVDAIYGTREPVYLTINVESIAACSRLDEILGAAVHHGIQQVTIGRSDLSHSMGAAVSDLAVRRLVEEVSEKAKARGLVVAVGGTVTPEDAAQLARILGSIDKIETRNVVFSTRKPRYLRAAISAAIDFEIRHLKQRQEMAAQHLNELTRRLDCLRERRGRGAR